MAEDYGLIGGIGQGLQAGMQAYNSERDRQLKIKQYQDQIEAKQLAQKQAATTLAMQQTEKGLIKDSTSDTGFSLNPQMQQQKDLGLLKLKGEAQQYDSNDPQVRSLLSSQGVKVPEGVSLNTIKQVEPILKYKASSDANKIKTAEVTNDKQEKLYTDYVTNRNKFRGDKAVQSANDAIRNADVALDLASRYPDLNKMPEAQVNLLRDEMAKMATNGAATAHATNDISTKTLVSNWENFMSKVGNNPTGAQLGEFLKNDLQYIKDMRETNKGVVDEYRGNNFAAYQHSLKSPELKERQINEFPEDKEAFDRLQGKKKVGGLIQNPSTNAALHPKDSVAVQWAKANPQDPRAAAIMKANGL